jgi:hypothetical protein
MPLDYNLAIMMHDMNRSRRRIVVMVMNAMFVVAIAVAPMMPAVVVGQGDPYTEENHKNRNQKYFQYLALQGVLLFRLNLPG